MQQEAIVSRLPQPFQDEMKGISTATGIDLGIYSIYGYINCVGFKSTLVPDHLIKFMAKMESLQYSTSLAIIGSWKRMS